MFADLRDEEKERWNEVVNSLRQENENLKAENAKLKEAVREARELLACESFDWHVSAERWLQKWGRDD